MTPHASAKPASQQRPRPHVTPGQLSSTSTRGTIARSARGRASASTSAKGARGVECARVKRMQRMHAAKNLLQRSACDGEPAQNLQK